MRPDAGRLVSTELFRFSGQFHAITIWIGHHEEQVVARTMPPRAEEDAATHAREPVAPPWRELLPVLRRLEMRGEIRGGRFVSGVAGEQFALPDAVERLRQHRERPDTEQWNVISAVDPVNLVGVITRDVRVPSVRGNRIVLLNGQPIAARGGRSIPWLAAQ